MFMFSVNFSLRSKFWRHHIIRLNYDVFKLKDIFEIQDTISEKVLEKLQIKLILGTSFDDDRKYFKDPENWQRFLKANSLWLSYSKEGVKKAGALFDEIFKFLVSLLNFLKLIILKIS